MIINNKLYDISKKKKKVKMHIIEITSTWPNFIGRVLDRETLRY